MAKNPFRSGSGNHGFVCVGGHLPPTLRTVVFKQAMRFGNWIGSWPVARNIITLSLVSLTAGHLYYFAAWKSAQRLYAKPILSQKESATLNILATSFDQVRQNHEPTTDSPTEERH